VKTILKQQVKSKDTSLIISVSNIL